MEKSKDLKNVLKYFAFPLGFLKIIFLLYPASILTLASEICRLQKLTFIILLPTPKLMLYDLLPAEGHVSTSY
jgi:hypothetical protein